MKRLIFSSLFLISFFFIPAKVAAAARFYLEPSSGSYKVGETITASVMIDSGGQAINSGEGSMTWSTDNLEYQSISSSGSIFTFWTSGPSGGSTSASFGGGLANPGYTGSAGKVITLTWKVKSTGTGKVTISGSKILANDGSGTNVYGSSSGGTFTLVDASSTIKATAKPKAAAVTVTSSSHSDQNKRYSENNVSLSWFAPSTISGYVYTFDQNASTDPSGNTVKNTSVSYANTAEGIWYFHIKGKTTDGFTSVVHYKIQIDATAPDDFVITVTNNGGSTDPTPKVTFETKDSGSGIDRYEARIDGGEVFAITSGDLLPKHKPGSHTLIIKAIDKAGHAKESTATYKIDGITPPVIISFDKFVGLLSPIHFTGRTSADDTIYLTLNGKEVAKFVAKDKQVSVASGVTGEIVWEYTYVESLFPGNYSFKFSRTTPSGAESEPTQSLDIRVESQIINIYGRIIPTTYVVYGLLGVVGLLVFVVAYLIYKLRHTVVRGVTSIGSAIGLVKKQLKSAEKEVLHDVDQVIPNHELSAGTVTDVKKELKQTIRKTFEEESKL